MSIYTLLLVLVTVYYHRIAMLYFSYNITSYTLHIHFLCVYFSFSFILMPANTLKADTRNNCMYPKVLSLYETVICICMYSKVLSLYETVISVWPKRGCYSDPNGIYVIDPNEVSISVSVCCSNCIFPIGMPIYPSTRSEVGNRFYYIFFHVL